MKLIIIGRNRAQISKVKLKTWEMKRWFVSGTDQYKMPPDAFQRLIATRYGHPIRDDEGMIYREGSLTPYHCRNQDFTTNRLLMEVRAHKVMAKNGKAKMTDLIAKANVRSWIHEIYIAGPTLLVFIIVLWALIF